MTAFKLDGWLVELFDETSGTLKPLLTILSEDGSNCLGWRTNCKSQADMERKVRLMISYLKECPEGTAGTFNEWLKTLV